MNQVWRIVAVFVGALGAGSALAGGLSAEEEAGEACGWRWTKEDEATLQSLAEEERERQITAMLAEQKAEAYRLAKERQRVVAAEWADLRAKIGEPAQAQPAAILEVQQKIAQWRMDEVVVAMRQIALSGEVSWDGRSIVLDEVIKLKELQVTVDHGATIQEAEAWLEAVRYARTGISPPRGPTLGDPIILGALDKSLIDAVLRQHIEEIRLCYQLELAKNPALAGKITVKFVIAQDGSVSSVTTKSTTMNNPAVESCINKAFMKFLFPSPQGGGIVIASYPFVFSPG